MKSTCCGRPPLFLFVLCWNALHVGWAIVVAKEVDVDDPVGALSILLPSPPFFLEIESATLPQISKFFLFPPLPSYRTRTKKNCFPFLPPYFLLLRTYLSLQVLQGPLRPGFFNAACPYAAHDPILAPSWRLFIGLFSVIGQPLFLPRSLIGL